MREGDDRVALALKTREVAARCMLLYAEPYRREPPFPRSRAGDVSSVREEPEATAEEAEPRSPYQSVSTKKNSSRGSSLNVPARTRPRILAATNSSGASLA